MLVSFPPFFRRTCLGLAVGAAAFGLPIDGRADCPCRSQGSVVAAEPVSGQVLSSDLQMSEPPQVLSPQPGALNQNFLGSPVVGGATGPLVNRFAVSPPPGTLGQTYQRRSQLMPDEARPKASSIEKHPRGAAVDVYLPEEVDVTARGLKPHWTGKVWRLETADPLLPGIPHIYAIKAERRNKAGEVTSTDVRWVRLIMGRVVDLEF